MRQLDNEQGELDIVIDEHAFDIISITKKKNKNPGGMICMIAAYSEGTGRLKMEKKKSVGETCSLGAV